ncbi:MFS general substrate transporter [Pseudovirgaria hyperparasitica]|uniref:MFS general substrate transporter n=1 Tax=Pseudovirgaria hyperparasitica TaxID=470096 RepID=A0A6A6WE88_9PEZI|nr:MFS general substrate transporter [Pseudovirgaria hyperparasitica]KAF2761142.1 MFS general substrate transporter [Pseudovirgaria hyperparasitica]
MVNYVPSRCRWDPEKPPHFSMSMNFMFAFAGCVTSANMYYTHPILNVMAEDFGVEYEEVSQIPTVMQAGYAAGLFFLCPLGDLLRRRAFVTWLVAFTATLWIVLCVTKSLAVFTAISFITAVTTVTPQLMVPLVGDLAPPHRRAAAISIVVSGLVLGLVLARVIAGTITNWVSWRYVYWMSLGLQYLIFILLWLFMPDYPSSNPQGLNYFKMLLGIPWLFRYPVLAQASIVSFFAAATYTNYWTTLSFLLAGPPYHYSSLVIGLFGLISIAGMLLVPVYARLVIDRFVPLFSVITGELMCLIGILISTYTGTFTVAGPIMQAFLNDLGMQIAQISNRSSIYAINHKARNRVNTAFMVATFCGQLTGTAAGNHIYAVGGWVRSGSASVGLIGAALVVCFLRGPWEEGWIGWRGGWSIFKKDAQSADGKTSEKATLGGIRATAVGENGIIDTEQGSLEKAADELDAEDRTIRTNKEESDREINIAHLHVANDIRNQ